MPLGFSTGAFTGATSSSLDNSSSSDDSSVSESESSESPARLKNLDMMLAVCDM